VRTRGTGFAQRSLVVGMGVENGDAHAHPNVEK
jgi:hypothetical protein